ncbi:MAG: DUF4248 domain-containing protein, partial [Tannerellaceae bacterium]|nr:DUF4248 domain-containing protein [Tannerellaceae bacterium]
MERDDFKIRCYGWSELAIAYNPEVCTETARKRLRQWVLR